MKEIADELRKRAIVKIRREAEEKIAELNSSKVVEIGETYKADSGRTYEVTKIVGNPYETDDGYFQCKSDEKYNGFSVVNRVSITGRSKYGDDLIL